MTVARRVAIVGATGQLAHDLTRVWAEHCPGDEMVGLTHADVEVADLSSVRAALRARRPGLVINTSAYHKVDVVEGDPDRAFAVNATGVRHLALACRELDAVLVHMSTDYVFSGRKAVPYSETDTPDAINVYGVSKAAGESLLRYLWPKHFIVRSSGLYGVAGSSGKGGNFVELMFRLARDGKPIRVVNDQTLTPTATRALAAQIALLSRTAAYGTYHATCEGQCTWFEFAAEIFRQVELPVALSPQTTAESGARARRPPYSVLDNRGLRLLGLNRMPSWQDALVDYLVERKTTVDTAL